MLEKWVQTQISPRMQRAFSKRITFKLQSSCVTRGVFTIDICCEDSLTVVQGVDPTRPQRNTIPEVVEDQIFLSPSLLQHTFLAYSHHLYSALQYKHHSQSKRHFKYVEIPL